MAESLPTGRPRVVIVVEGGVVQDCYAEPDCSVTIIDLDALYAEGISEEDDDFHDSLRAGEFTSSSSPLGTFEYAEHLPEA